MKSKALKPEDFIKIVVTDEDVKNGVAADCDRCPIALACERHFGCRVSVGVDTVTVRGVEYKLPELAQGWQYLYDCRPGSVNGFHFTITGVWE